MYALFLKVEGSRVVLGSWLKHQTLDTLRIGRHVLVALRYRHRVGSEFGLPTYNRMIRITSRPTGLRVCRNGDPVSRWLAPNHEEIGSWFNADTRRRRGWHAVTTTYNLVRGSGSRRTPMAPVIGLRLLTHPSDDTMLVGAYELQRTLHGTLSTGSVINVGRL